MTMIDVRGAHAFALDAGKLGMVPMKPVALAVRADKVAAVAALHAARVDSDSRFPSEAIDAARQEGLLGMMVPREFGGEGASLGEVMDVCYKLGRACSSSAMIFAMHQTKVACVVNHGRGSPWHERMLRRLCADQLLLASSTTEGQNGGNVRSSAAAVDVTDAGIALDRAATVISYGAQADGIVTTARRAADAASSDQVLVVFLKDDYSLERTLEWDTLGMRGTCSAGFALRASGSRDQILPVPYEKIHSQTMTPVAHLCWSSVWSGIAASAVERAQAFTRKAARGAGGQLPSGRGALYQGNVVAADPVRPRQHRLAPLRDGAGGRAGAGLHRLPDRHQPHQGGRVRTGGGDRDERAPGLRAVGLSQRRGRQRRPAVARRAVLAADDQQRPYPVEPVDLLADEHRAGLAGGLNGAHRGRALV